MYIYASDENAAYGNRTKWKEQILNLQIIYTKNRCLGIQTSVPVMKYDIYT
jgi:hypothetical protein